jgi:hypothetical protein
MKRLNKVPITTDSVILNTYEVTCSSCHRTKYPSLIETPTSYVCVLCRSGVSEARRHAARRVWQARHTKAKHAKDDG